jgi:hypothetical protein
MGECGDVRKMRKTWGLLLGCWGRQRGRGRGEDADERAGGYGLSRTDAERGSSGTVDDSQCGTSDDPPKAFSFFSLFEV